MNDSVQDTQKAMDDCQIPVNIKIRGSEVEQFTERLENIHHEFRDLKQADADFEGTSASEAEIKAIIVDIEGKLKGFDHESRDHAKFQTHKLEKYRERDIMSPENYLIIAEVRDFKGKIKDTNDRLKDLEDLLKELNTKLILQDMANALKLLEKKSKNLRERLTEAKTELKKISTAGDEMDGNTSNNEEEEFIEALKDEMPEVFRNIEGNFTQLDKIEELITDIRATDDIEKM